MLSGEIAVYTMVEAAQILKVSPSTIKRLVSRGKIKSCTVGRAVRIPIEHLKSFMIENTRGLEGHHAKG